MVRNLGWIAVGGLSIGVACLSLASAIGGEGWYGLVGRGFAFDRSCVGDGAKADSSATERRWTWDGGDTIDIAVPATVHFRGGDGDEVIARGPSDILARIEVSGGRIRLDCHHGARWRTVDITLPGRPFRHIGLSGSGNVIMENVSQPDLNLRISGSGNLQARGASDHVTVKISGSGRARLAELAMKEFTVNVSGSGNAEAAPKDVADIKVSGSGNVRLFSHPAQLRSHVAGSGRITQQD